jgi:ABC-type transporter Mla MlaB component
MKQTFLLQGDCLKTSAPNIRRLHFCSTQLRQQRNNLRALERHDASTVSLLCCHLASRHHTSFVSEILLAIKEK